jgi:hypothetical protein
MIKKLTVILVFIVLIFSSAYAQKLQFGLSIGYSVTSISPRPYYDEELVYGLCGGVVVNYLLNKKLAVHTGLLYFKKGVDGVLSSWGALQVLTPIHMRVEYLELPILLKYNPIQNLYLGAGPYLAKKIGGELTLYGHEERYDWIKQVDLGYVLMGGIDFKLLRKKHFIEVRFSRGAISVVSDRNNMVLACIYGIYF